MPTVLAGTVVNGKANFLTVAYCGIVQHSPAMISVTLGKQHYTNSGIKENRSFSVNIPSENLMKVTDYCGIQSGEKVDKGSLFEVFYGELGNAPLIKECAVNLECRLVEILDFGGSNEIFIGEIVEAYCDGKYLTNGLPDIAKIKPILFSMHDNTYWSVGKQLGKAWSIGADYTK